MNSETVNLQGNGVVHVPTCPTPATWPPPWLAEAAEKLPAGPIFTPARLSESAAPAPVPTLPVTGPPEEDGCEIIDPPAPCPKCGSLELWQDLLGAWHCQHCDGAAFRRSCELLKRAARLRGITAAVSGVKLAAGPARGREH
ncbi:MAG: hypothetical protein ABSG68_11820 [Thermoguttaceae bacterium]